MAPFTPSIVYSALRRFLVDELRPRGDVKYIHVSEVCQCLRKSWFNRKFGSLDLKHLSDSKVVVLAYGLALHHVLAKYVTELDSRYVPEQEIEYVVDNDLVLVGRPDLVCEDYVVEFKTCRKLPERPYEHHLMQINAYMNMLRKSTGYLVYISAYGEVAVHDVVREEYLWRAVVERARKLQRYLLSNDLPSREESILCQWCEWRFKCTLTAFS